MADATHLFFLPKHQSFDASWRSYCGELARGRAPLYAGGTLPRNDRMDGVSKWYLSKGHLALSIVGALSVHVPLHMYRELRNYKSNAVIGLPHKG